MGLSNTRRLEKQLETAFYEVQQATIDRVYEVDFKRWFKVMLEDCMLTVHHRTTRSGGLEFFEIQRSIGRFSGE